jgi:hypothetical protein
VPGWPVPDPGRPLDVTGLTVGELERARRELQVSLALGRPDSPVRSPILAQLNAINAELAERAGRCPTT